jgi:3-deoxy-7-phosphoheptulonate synthase
MIEVHNNPEKALSDGPQSPYPEQFDRLMGELRIIAPLLGLHAAARTRLTGPLDLDQAGCYCIA